MSTAVTHLPPVVTPIADPQTGLPSLAQLIWQQELLLSRSPWIPYTPTVTHLSAITINDCAFSAAGKRVSVRISITGTSDGSPALITLPFKAKSVGQTFAVADYQAGNTGLALISGDLLTVQVTKYDGSSPVNASVHGWVIEGSYEAQ